MLLLKKKSSLSYKEIAQEQHYKDFRLRHFTKQQASTHFLKTEAENTFFFFPLLVKVTNHRVCHKLTERKY